MADERFELTIAEVPIGAFGEGSVTQVPVHRLSTRQQQARAFAPELTPAHQKSSAPARESARSSAAFALERLHLCSARSSAVQS
jgi:hypothetical protein